MMISPHADQQVLNPSRSNAFTGKGFCPVGTLALGTLSVQSAGEVVVFAAAVAGF
jgi:hypothetical protein